MTVWIRFILSSTLFLFIALALSSCEPAKNYARAVYMLIDVSGTYVKEIGQANRIIRILVTKLDPGDTFMLGRIDSNSFSEKDVIVNVKFDRRSTTANAQKIATIKKVDRFSKEVKSSRYTDITGGILQAIEYLNRTKAGRKTLIIFSDLKEEIKSNQIRNVKLNFKGIRVISVNVKKLKSDALDPTRYYKRLKFWEKRVTSGNGIWEIVAANEKGKILELVMQ